MLRIWTTALKDCQKSFESLVQLRAGCGTDRIKKEGRKLPCEPETQPGLLQLACWVGNIQCQTSGDEQSRVISGRTYGSCSHTRPWIKRIRRCTSRSHPMHWHKNNRVQAVPSPSFFFFFSSQPILNVLDNGSESRCKDISTEYPSSFGIMWFRVPVLEHLTFLNRFFFFPLKLFKSLQIFVLHNLLWQAFPHNLTTHSMKNHSFFFLCL